MYVISNTQSSINKWIQQFGNYAVLLIPDHSWVYDPQLPPNRIFSDDIVFNPEHAIGDIETDHLELPEI